MAKHTFYGTWKEEGKALPLLEILIHEYHDDPQVVAEAGERFGRWLSDNASAAWMKGLRAGMGPAPTNCDIL